MSHDKLICKYDITIFKSQCKIIYLSLSVKYIISNILDFYFSSPTTLEHPLTTNCPRNSKKHECGKPKM